MSQTEIWRLSATELAAAIKTRQISAREAALAGLARLDDVNPRLNAVVDHRPEDVLAQADAIDQRLAAGEECGPLAGVPVTIKVNTDQTGYATTNGLRMQKDQIATQDSPVVSNLRKSGAVMLGRTNTPAFSLRWFTTNQLHGDTKNPHDPGLTPGGSSGGAASALAAGIGHLAHGTDIGGSVRYPAYACGVHGLRPSLGRIPAWNASGPERSIGAQVMAVSGPIARSIADIRLGLHAMAQPDARDPWFIPTPFTGPTLPKHVTLCVRPNGMTVAPEVEAALRDAASRLKHAGYTVTEIDDTPSFRDATLLQVQLWIGDGFPAFSAAVEREGDPASLTIVNGLRNLAGTLPADIVARAMVARATLTRTWQLFLEQHPVLLLPVSGELPFADNEDQRGPDAMARVLEAQIIPTGLPLMGLPGLTVTTGLVGTCPVGVQLIGQRWREDLLLAAGEAIEAGGAPVSVIDPR